MNTLREILEFVGLSGPQKFSPVPGNSAFTDPTMRTVGLQVPILTNEQRSSMRAMILGLQNLPRISLEAEAEVSVGEVPLGPRVHVHSSNGVILETIGSIFQNGVLVKEMSGNTGASDASIGSVRLNDPGSYQFEVRRVGIPNTGITTLRKTFDIIARARPAPPRPPPPQSPPPRISVVYHGPAASAKFDIKGTGFTPNHAVHIRGVNSADIQHPAFGDTVSDSSGAISMTVHIPCVPGTQLHFSANDERPDKTDLTGTLWSNTVTITAS